VGGDTSGSPPSLCQLGSCAHPYQNVQNGSFWVQAVALQSRKHHAK
jgi:hypothetical protein